MPVDIRAPLVLSLSLALCAAATARQSAPPPAPPAVQPPAAGGAFCEPVRLMADGQPIDLGRLSKYAHAGPSLADLDGDGDRDLVVGDFPGYFWLFENTGTDRKPVYTGKGKLQAGGQDAKTPVY